MGALILIRALRKRVKKKNANRSSERKNMTFIDSAVLMKSQAAKKLIDHKVPSRMAAKDGSVFDFDKEVAAYASERLGWTTLASNPPTDPCEVAVLAQQARGEGLDAVVLIGQGGSTQAAQTITKLHSLDVPGEIPFRTMDSLSPVYVNHILGSSDPARTLYMVSSKSGSTLEPTMASHVAWKYVCAHLGKEHAGSRFVAITDPGSELEAVARKNSWRAILHGCPEVGGRYSALSVFGLMPMASVGIDVEQTLKDAVAMEKLCASDSPENPALHLATFLYESLQKGRDKFSLIMPPRNQVFGLWVEQLVAESLGKNGVGILPNVEVDAGILADYYEDRSVILCNINNSQAFEHAHTCIHPDMPVFRVDIPNVNAMANHFLIWEYAIAFTGWLMQLNPFDQPDVESTKQATRKLLSLEDVTKFEVPQDDDGNPAYQEYEVKDICGADRVYVSSVLLNELEPSMQENMDLGLALRLLFRSLKEKDYFSFNAFLPFRGVGRRECLERVRHRVADRMSTAACLEIGPRFLHSTGQLHKGGSNTGVFLVVSSDEPYDIKIPHKDCTLGDVENAEALGDFSALAARGRRAVYVHLKDNDSEYLTLFADEACAAISAAYAHKIH